MTSPNVVVDASALAAWLIPDEDCPQVTEVLAAGKNLTAPLLLRTELLNVLAMAERRGRIAFGYPEGAFAILDQIGLSYSATVPVAGVIDLVRRHRLTVYAGLYLDLALSQGAALLTRDRALAEAARREAVEVL